jgi:phosphatidylglycerol:prolipoprotein diacylglycerol transferase
MHQILFRLPIFNLPIYSYGLMMVIGFLAAIQLAKFLARRSGLDPEFFINAGLIALIAGVVGARLSHVIENIHQYTDPHRSIWANFLDAINIRAGGLTYYGGFLLCFPALIFYAWKKKIPLRLGMDIVAPCIVIGLGFGRIGCFLNGCCYGAVCEAPWAVQFPYHSIAYEDEFYENQVMPPPQLIVPSDDGTRGRLVTPEEIHAGILAERSESGLPIPVDPAAAQLASAEKTLPLHPAQLYSSFTAFLIAAIVLCYFTLPHIPGRAFALMMMLEGTTRFILELLRVEPPVIGNFSLSMILGIVVATLGLILWFAFAIGSQPRLKPAIA